MENTSIRWKNKWQTNSLLPCLAITQKGSQAPGQNQAESAGPGGEVPGHGRQRADRTDRRLKNPVGGRRDFGRHFAGRICRLP